MWRRIKTRKRRHIYIPISMQALRDGNRAENL
jgi:hypothetical protein